MAEILDRVEERKTTELPHSIMTEAKKRIQSLLEKIG
jgi:hypothetical protein